MLNNLSSLIMSKHIHPRGYASAMLLKISITAFDLKHEFFRRVSKCQTTHIFPPCRNQALIRIIQKRNIHRRLATANFLTGVSVRDAYSRWVASRWGVCDRNKPSAVRRVQSERRCSLHRALCRLNCILNKPIKSAIGICCADTNCELNEIDVPCRIYLWRQTILWSILLMKNLWLQTVPEQNKVAINSSFFACDPPRALTSPPTETFVTQKKQWLYLDSIDARQIICIQMSGTDGEIKGEREE